MSTFVKHEPCPKCGSRDNLARYSDGSAWCFGCSYFERGGISPLVEERNLRHMGQADGSTIRLPDDLSFNFPPIVVEWLGKYDISVEEAIKANIKWSPSWEQLSFIFKDENNNVLFTQARNFNKERANKRKYYNQGSPQDILPIFHAPAGEKACRRITITEDALSSLKIARQSDAMPALGTYLPARKISALKLLNYEHMNVWLDQDKYKEAVEMATMAKWLGMSSKVIYTELDPKCYTNEEISKWLS